MFINWVVRMERPITELYQMNIAEYWLTIAGAYWNHQEAEAKNDNKVLVNSPEEMEALLKSKGLTGPALRNADG